LRERRKYDKKQKKEKEADKYFFHDKPPMGLILGDKNAMFDGRRIGNFCLHVKPN